MSIEKPRPTPQNAESGNAPQMVNSQNATSVSESEHSEQFLRLYMRHENNIRAFVRSGLRSWDDTDDVMQEVAIVAMRKFNPETDSDMFRRWLFVVARYEILKFRRSKARDRLVLSEGIIEAILADGINEAEDELAEKRKQSLNQCLLKLPQQRRELVMAAYARGNTIKDIAEKIGKRPDALRQMLRRIRLDLAQCMTQSVEQSGDLA